MGTLAGHTDGITFIDSRVGFKNILQELFFNIREIYVRAILMFVQGDGRYLISNCKDQSIKLWDVRKFSGQSALEVY